MTAADARRRWRQKQREQGLCLECTRPADRGSLCDEHARIAAARRRHRGDRVPTFEDFERLVDGHE